MKNLCNKVRTKDNPYEVWEGKGWTWYVLRKYQANDDKPYAIAFCFVTSPYCPEGEFGDTYIQDYQDIAVLTETNYEQDKTNP